MIDYTQLASAMHHGAHIKNLGLIRDTCTGIQTPELLISPEDFDYALNDDVTTAKATNLLDMRFKNIPSLKRSLPILTCTRNEIE